MSSIFRSLSPKKRRAMYFIVAGCLLIVFGLAWGSLQSDPRELAEIARERARQTPIKTTSHPYEDRAHVEALGAEARKRGKAAFEERLQRHVQGESIFGAGPRTPSAPTQPPPARANKPTVAGRLVVALSSSMPETMLRDYMRQLSGVPESIVVLRGFVGGAHTVGPTGTWAEKASRKQPDCRTCGRYSVEVIVDPLVYRMLEIDKVPAVAWLPGVQDLGHCDAQNFKAPQIVYGAVSVSSALQRLSKDGVEIPAPLLKVIGARS